MVLLLRKQYLYYTKDPEAVHYIPGGGGGCPTFSRGVGVQMLISIETHIVLVIFQGGVRTPYPPYGSAYGQCHHSGTILITVQLLTIIARH